MKNNTTINDIRAELNSRNPKLKKGDTCFLVEVRQGYHWQTREGLRLEEFNGIIACRAVTIQSLGKIQGTATDIDTGSSIYHRIYPELQVMAKTKEDCLAIAETYKQQFLENGKACLAHTIKREHEWVEKYGSKARPEVLQEAQATIEALETYEVGAPVVRFY